MRSEGLSTLDIDRLGLLDIPYRAGISFNSKGSGKINALKSSTFLQVGSGNVKNYFIPNSELILSTENNRVKARASVFNQKAVANLDYGWAEGASSNLDLEAHSLDFLPALVVVNPNILDEPKIESSFTGKAKLSFKTGDFAQLTGLVDVRELVLNRLENSFSLAEPLKFEIKDGDYRFDRMRIAGDATSIVWSGKAEEDC